MSNNLNHEPDYSEDEDDGLDPYESDFDYDLDTVKIIFSSSTSVYLDRDQCAALGVSYYDFCYWKSVRADVLLASKGGDGYDDRHFEILGPMRAKMVRLARVKAMDPGWFRVLK